MKLLTIGDSFTYGEELRDRNKAWPHVLGKLLDYEVTNLGQPGCSNNAMVRTAIEHSNEYDLIVTLEENVIAGGAGSGVNELLVSCESNCKILNLGLPDTFIEHGSCETLLAKYGLDAQTIQLKIAEQVNNK